MMEGTGFSYESLLLNPAKKSPHMVGLGSIAPTQLADLEKAESILSGYKMKVSDAATSDKSSFQTIMSQADNQYFIAKNNNTKQIVTGNTSTHYQDGFVSSEGRQGGDILADKGLPVSLLVDTDSNQVSSGGVVDGPEMNAIRLPHVAANVKAAPQIGHPLAGPDDLQDDLQIAAARGNNSPALPTQNGDNLPPNSLDRISDSSASDATAKWQQSLNSSVGWRPGDNLSHERDDNSHDLKTPGTEAQISLGARQGADGIPIEGVKQSIPLQGGLPGSSNESPQSEPVKTATAWQSPTQLPSQIPNSGETAIKMLKGVETAGLNSPNHDESKPVLPSPDQDGEAAPLSSSANEQTDTARISPIAAHADSETKAGTAAKHNAVNQNAVNHSGANPRTETLNTIQQILQRELENTAKVSDGAPETQDVAFKPGAAAPVSQFPPLAVAMPKERLVNITKLSPVVPNELGLETVDLTDANSAVSSSSLPKWQLVPSILQQHQGDSLTGHVSTPMPMKVPFGHPEWGQAVAEKVMWMSSKNLKVVELQLDPPELGQLQVRVSVQNDQASVQFVTPQVSVKEALDMTAFRLRELMAQEGIDLVDVDVSDGSAQKQQRGESGEQGAEQSSGNSLGRNGLSGGAGEDTVEQTSVALNLSKINLVDYFV